MRPSDYHIHHDRKVTDPAAAEATALERSTRSEQRWARAGNILANIGLVLTALCLGAITLLAVGSTVWLMIDADDGNLTQSMSIFTVFNQPTWPILFAGFLGGAALIALLRFVWAHGSALDGPQGLRALIGATFAFQLVIILAMQTRDTFWGDSWMVNDFVTKALKSGTESLFTGAYKTLFYDARLYFSCYPFQASFYWLMLGLRSLFGDLGYIAFQILSAAVTEIGVLSLVVLGNCLGFDKRARRLTMVLIAACLPMFWLSTFLYGNAMGCGFALAFLACQALATRATSRNSTLRWVALSLIPLALALCIKATFILFAIGAVLAWIVIAVRRRSAWALAGTLAVVALANTLSGLPFEALRAASNGYEFMGSLTTLNHLELGLRMGRGEFYISIDGGAPSFAPGGWSNYANAVWETAAGDADLQNQSAAAALAEDFSDFAVAPDYAAWFFTTKLATEWADPTYQSLYYLSMCGLSNDGRVNPADTATPLGVTCTVLIFILDGYQSITFAAALCFLIWAIHHWEDDSPLGAGSIEAEAFKPVTLLLAATFFTGFGCYLLWEAKAVYVLPYAIVLIPLAAAGLATFFSWTKSKRTT